MYKKLIIIGIMLIFVTGCIKDPVSTTTGIINDAKEQAKIRSSELAYSSVEYAITSYMYRNNGDVPTKVEDIQAYFISDLLEMKNGKIIEKSSGEELCKVTKVSRSFEVDCKYLDEVKIVET